MDQVFSREPVAGTSRGNDDGTVVGRGTEDTLPNINIVQRNSRFSCKYQTTFSTVSVRLVNFNTVSSERFIPELHRVINSFLNNVLHEGDYSHVRLVMRSSSLSNAVNLPLILLSELTAERLLLAIERVVQSHENVMTDELLSFDFVLINLNHIRGGAGIRKRGLLSLDRTLDRKKSVVTIRNNDSLCLGRAIVVGRAFSLKSRGIISNREYRNVRRHDRSITQTTLARDLYQSAGVPQGEGGLTEVHMFQQFLTPEYQIIVFSAEEDFRPVFVGAEAELKIYILYKSGHFDTITNPIGFFGGPNFCTKCLKPTSENHLCPGECRKCGSDVCPREDCQYVKCLTCNRFFNGSVCLQLHRDTNMCNKKHRCVECSETYRPGRHVCKKHDFVQTLSQPASRKTFSFMYFDCETVQLDDGTLDPVLFVVSFLSESGEWVYKDFPHVDSFMNWFLSSRDGNKNIVTLMAHNLQKFDGFPLLDYLYRHQLKPDIVFNGGKILGIFLSNMGVRIIDTLSYIQAPLRAFPKTFGIRGVRKGFFPYKFCKKNNLDYTGPIPGKEYFEPNYMSPESSEEFELWYANQTGTWNLWREMLAYCTDDVRILREGGEAFRNEFSSVSGVDPFQYDITLAGACLRVFRQRFLKQNTLAIIPGQGYSANDPQSRKAIAWLRYIEEGCSINLQTALSPQGEHRVGPYKLDGVNHEYKHIFCFNGCYWHGHNCVPHQGVVLKEMGKRFFRTMDREAYIKESLPEYTLVKIWECEFDKLVKRDPFAQHILEITSAPERIGRRDFLFGGRTEPFTLYAKSSEAKTISYVDFNSLYPYCCKYGKFGKGHPERICKDFDYSMNAYFGIVRATVLPPEQLFIPLLPIRQNDKLMFGLCNACCAALNPGYCTHNDLERMITGSWTSFELYKSLEVGYKLVKLHDVWHFKETIEYDRINKTEGLYDGYINSFLLGKQQYSGFPSDIVTDDDKQRYCNRFFQAEGIALDPNTVCRNSVRRLTCKLALNSSWGKLGENMDKPQTTIIDCPVKYMALLTDPSKIVTDICGINSNQILVAYKTKTEYVPANKKGNVIVAAMVTSYARLKLFDLLSKLGRRVLYCDTDSAIFETEPHDTFRPDLGDFLGELVDEIESKYGPRVIIEEYVASAPKTYALRLSNNQSVIRCKGITLNKVNAEKFTFELLHSMVVEKSTQKVSFPKPFNVVRDKYLATLKNIPSKIMLQYTFTKRWVKDGGFVSYPYGYK